MSEPLPIPVEHRGARDVEGPLLVVDAVGNVGWDEFVTVRLPSGEVRRGLVLEVDRALAVVQVLEGTSGIDPDEVIVAFVGQPFGIPVGDGWLGRVWNGMGDPLDGGPPMLGPQTRPVAGAPLNPTVRDVPRDPILTGISAIDALTTLVRGQKLPVFSSAGLPHFELAAQIAAQAHAGGQPFKVVVAAMGVTHADAAAIRDVLETRSEAGDLALFLDTADDPVVQRILTPRVALTVAEHLAFDLGQHVLVVLADMTSYCEAVREVSAARGEIPGRRAYPGYLYSDLASIYERCGRRRDRPGSVTLVPVLTMPAGDITHPVPDLTGYITEGQVVLSPVVHGEGVYPPVDVLGSLSRLMRKGTGEGRTRADHPAIAAQIIAALARARQARDLADLIGAAALTETDRRYLAFADECSSVLLNQRPDELRTLEDTLERAWRAASVLPRRELTMVSAAEVEAHYTGGELGTDEPKGPGAPRREPGEEEPGGA
ncbi:MAG TPA: V-type ATP synthase subunit B [Candidatus Dormibacteraeota bacterium]|nr:V-type ATP synthase subunit B [Candidatus Dormibacteraeota bacterium]